MHRRFLIACLSAALVIGLGACHSKKIENPMATVDSKQPDKVLYERAIEAIKNKKYETGRITLQTLINTYPDSEYLARAKMALGDSWVAEGGPAALSQAENEYRDFITFFPNLPEAAEAQMKIANIQFKQMQKPDRDFSHAKRAETEYRQMILQYPDSKLTPEAKERLREVQEVLGEREFRIGRFYYLREAWPATIARLESLVDRYPLYSKADEALMMLGDAYEQQAQAVESSKATAEQKQRLLAYDQNQAATAYSRVITRYPASDRAGDAEKRLEALHRPVPRPTPEAIARSKAEIASRGKGGGKFDRIMKDFHRGPDLVETTQVGEPSLTDPKATNATDIVRDSMLVMEGKAQPGSEKVAVETVGTGAPAPNQAVPRSSAGGNGGAQDANGIPQLAPIDSTPASSPADPNATPKAAPPQVNDVATGNGATAASGDNPDGSSFSGNQASSSKTKKKKSLLRKVIPF